MLLVIPLSRSDKHLAQNAKKAFELFPPGGGHSLLVVGSPNVTSELNDLCTDLAGHFNDSSVHVFDHDNFYGWPSSCNYYFQQTCYHMIGHNVPWFWFELDTTPIKEGWLSAIQQEYNHNPVGFMGHIQDTIRGWNGIQLTPDDAGKHMAACGVYPGDITGSVIPLKGVSDTDIVWWHFIRWYVAPYARHTKLIQNNYKTVNYRTEVVTGHIDAQSDPNPYPPFTVMGCDSCNNTAWGDHYNYAIQEKTPAVLIHGCKDGSLLDLLTPRDRVVHIDTSIAAKALPQLSKLFTAQSKPKPKSYRRKRKKVLGLAPV